MNPRTLVLLAVAASACGGTRSAQQPPHATQQAASRAITLERPRCYGECPTYTVTLGDNGAVRYEGIANVATLGSREWRVPVDSALKVFRFADSVRFADMKPKYEFGLPECLPFMADRAAFAIVLASGARATRVHADEGCANLPGALLSLRDLVDRTVRIGGSVYLRP